MINWDQVRFGTSILLVSLLMLLTIQLANAGKVPPMPEQRQNQGQEQRQGQGQGQTQGQVTTVDTDVSTVVNTTVNTDVNTTAEQTQSMGDMVGGSQTVEFNDVRQVHSANAPAIYSTSPCYVGGSAALGLAKINIGGGRAVVDRQCEMRETARILLSAGEVQLGVALLCMTEAGSLLGERCKYSADVRIQLAAARDRIAFLLNERAIDRKECNDSKNRIAAACNQK